MAHAAGRKWGSYFAAQCHRLAARRGKKPAAVAVAHSILVAVWHLLRDEDATYQDLGPIYLDQRDQNRVARRLLRRLEGLGYTVQLERPAA